MNLSSRAFPPDLVASLELRSRLYSVANFNAHPPCASRELLDALYPANHAQMTSLAGHRPATAYEIGFYPHGVEAYAPILYRLIDQWVLADLDFVRLVR